jgi:hypothetical protein
MFLQLHDLLRYLIVPLFLLAVLSLVRAAGIGLRRRLEQMPASPAEPRDTAAADPSQYAIGDVVEVPNWRRHIAPHDFALPYGAAAAREAGGGRAVPSGSSATCDISNQSRLS